MYARATAVSHVQSGEEWFQAWRDHTNRKKTLGAWGEPLQTAADVERIGLGKKSVEKVKEILQRGVSSRLAAAQQNEKLRVRPEGGVGGETWGWREGEGILDAHMRCAT